MSTAIAKPQEQNHSAPAMRWRGSLLADHTHVATREGRLAKACVAIAVHGCCLADPTISPSVICRLP